ncbi:MAG: NAD(P)/FAD-dependent oxidoreductase [Deltaproteobacteria bacterium]|nr:NAD(P)/FAD-dependent oxidoreductase [Deltaproteobacteria bacterium]
MRVAIVGAGPAGLAAAYDLTRAGHSVVIFEGAPGVGGLAAGFKAPHWEWSLEKFYHHWFQSDAAMLGLIKELGWSDRVLFPRPYTVLYHDGEFYPSDSIGTALKFFLQHYALSDVIRFGLVGLYLKATPRWQSLERYTAADWMRRWAGPRIYEAVWKPMLVGKFGEDNLSIVNMAWLWARIKSRTTRLGTFVGGFQAFLDQLADVVRTQGGEIRLSSTVTGIHPIANGRLRVETVAEANEFDSVISTSSPALTARMTPDLPEAYAGQLRALRSMGAVVLVVSLDRQLTKFYWHNLPKEAGFPFLALVEHTNFIGAEHYGGDRIIYCGDYLNPDHRYFQLSKEELLEEFLPSFARMNPQFERSWVKNSWLFKTTYAQPIPPVNHSQNIPALKTPIPGLYMASMSQVYPWDRGTNFAVEIGRRVAKMVEDDNHRL